jgi:hypothetical protein
MVLSIEVVTSRVTELCRHLVVNDSEKNSHLLFREGRMSQSELSMYCSYGFCLKRWLISDVGDHRRADLYETDTALLIFLSVSMIAFVASLVHLRLYQTSHCVDKTPVGLAVR